MHHDMKTTLNGLKVLVTRPVHQAKKLAQLIEQQGGEAIMFPTIAIKPVKHLAVIKKSLENIAYYQWLIFISVNAVKFVQQVNNGKLDTFKQANIIAIGAATAKALETIGLEVDLIPKTGFTSEALLMMPSLQAISGQRFLIIRGQGGRETLANILKQRGAKVDYLEVYKRVKPTPINEMMVIALIKQKKLDAITITSGEALNNLMTLLMGRIIVSLLFEIPLIVISTRIKNIALEIGFKHVLVSASPADTAIIMTVTTVCNGENYG